MTDDAISGSGMQPGSVRTDGGETGRLSEDGTDRSPYDCPCCGETVEVMGTKCDHCFVNCEGEHRV